MREKLAQMHGCRSNNIIAGNGSDELLALATRCFVDPVTEPRSATRKSPWNNAGNGPAPSSQTIQFLSPSYSLYPVLAAIHGAQVNDVALHDDFGLPTVAELQQGKRWDSQAALTFLTTPNAPSGRGYSTAELEDLCRAQEGVIVLDEAYADFAPENALDLALRYRHVLVARTFSKAYSLCFLRIGYFIGHPDLIAALLKIKDSYNVNGLGQVAALATLEDLPYYQANFQRIIATRQWLTRELGNLGFAVFPSQTNFVLARPPRFPARVWMEQLRERKVLVRWFAQSQVQDFLRITIGSDAEVEALVGAVRAVLEGGGAL
jgi:histidinol-phosphate aminotransferase